MEANYGLFAAACGLCAIVGIYYCWVRKMTKVETPAEPSPSGAPQ
jgi:hypothetical protein